MANVVYNTAKKKILDGDIDLANDTINLALVTSSYTPDIDTDEFFSDITNEVSGTGYTAGGETLTTTAVTVDTANDRAEFDADDVSWASSTITARGGVLYKDTGVDSTSPVIAYFDFTEDKVSTNGTFTVSWDAEGVLQLA